MRWLLTILILLAFHQVCLGQEESVNFTQTIVKHPDFSFTKFPDLSSYQTAQPHRPTKRLTQVKYMPSRVSSMIDFGIWTLEAENDNQATLFMKEKFSTSQPSVAGTIQTLELSTPIDVAIDDYFSVRIAGSWPIAVEQDSSISDVGKNYWVSTTGDFLDNTQPQKGQNYTTTTMTSFLQVAALELTIEYDETIQPNTTTTSTMTEAMTTTTTAVTATEEKVTEPVTEQATPLVENTTVSKVTTTTASQTPNTTTPSIFDSTTPDVDHGNSTSDKQQNNKGLDTTLLIIVIVVPIAVIIIIIAVIVAICVVKKKQEREKQKLQELKECYEASAGPTHGFNTSGSEDYMYPNPQVYSSGTNNTNGTSGSDTYAQIKKEPRKLQDDTSDNSYENVAYTDLPTVPRQPVKQVTLIDNEICEPSEPKNSSIGHPELFTNESYTPC